MSERLFTRITERKVLDGKDYSPETRVGTMIVNAVLSSKERVG